jgi:hypothetical protein
VTLNPSPPLYHVVTTTSPSLSRAARNDAWTRAFSANTPRAGRLTSGNAFVPASWRGTDRESGRLSARRNALLRMDKDTGRLCARAREEAATLRKDLDLDRLLVSRERDRDAPRPAAREAVPPDFLPAVVVLVRVRVVLCRPDP